jgi:hypothetical protein
MWLSTFLFEPCSAAAAGHHMDRSAWLGVGSGAFVMAYYLIHEIDRRAQPWYVSFPLGGVLLGVTF